MLKVFKVDEANWYAANTPDEAQAAYREDIGPEVDEYMADFGEPEQMSEEDLDKLKIADIDEPGHPSQTFREALVKLGKPGFIATTEYWG